MPSKWICIQLGSREHYAIPRVLHHSDRLAYLLTDTWISAKSARWISALNPALAQRRHPDIPQNLVLHSSARTLSREIGYRLSARPGWDTILRRNAQFQEWAARQVRNRSLGAEVGTVFSYSYTARLPFEAAKRRGLRCILGQLDPGPLEAAAVREAAAQYTGLGQIQEDAPPSYWADWREEVRLADVIVTNSPWSTELLCRAGVPAGKMVEIPLAYEAAGPRKIGGAPAAFTKERPLVVLFRGQMVLRKGVGQLFDAIRLMQGEPVHFVFAGPVRLTVPSWISTNPAVTIHGLVDRDAGERLYREADVFVLPTLSEGFAITQLEAQAHGLPLMVSRRCGAVVADGVNGIVLDDVRPETIVAALRRILAEPEQLKIMQTNSQVAEQFSMAALGRRLAEIG